MHCRLTRSSWRWLRRYAQRTQAMSVASNTAARRKIVFDNRLTLSDFLSRSRPATANTSLENETTTVDAVPYLLRPDGQKRQFYVEVYGCQMNVNDTEILSAILTNTGFVKTNDITTADVVFLMTCAIRDGAENKIWHRLRDLKALKTRRGISPKIGVVGCMAERLKDKLLDTDKLVDIVCGPDAYKSLPYLLSLNEESHSGLANVMLSADETYADITPLRIDEGSVSAHLSIMRGCNNMCSFCIVPFTRGIERSRSVASILQEIKRLSDQGVKEVTLLGQNVNSYLDISAPAVDQNIVFDTIGLAVSPSIASSSLSPGFSTIYKSRAHLDGYRFTELLARVAEVDPEMRIRFTSPHPKDFPLPLLHVIRENSNICNQIHLPAQSGSNSNLMRMRRGYTRESYLELVMTIRQILPNVALSTDIISGFCGETEQEHCDTVKLMKEVRYTQAFMFAYSMREKTHAHRRLTDDVPQVVKHARLAEIIDVFHQHARQYNQKHLIDTVQHVLVDGISKRDTDMWCGRAESNLKVNFTTTPNLHVLKGDFVAVRITAATSMSLIGHAMEKLTLKQFASSALIYKSELSFYKTRLQNK